MAIAAGMASAALIILFLWPRSGPGYAGRSVPDWFRIYHDRRANNFPPRPALSAAAEANVQSAFRAMGTNAVPYLASRIIQDLEYSRLALWRIRNRQRIPRFIEDRLPPLRSRTGEAHDAAELLAIQIKPPGEMLVPLLEPALLSTNLDQRTIAILALRGISSGFELTRPHLVRGLKDPDAQLQKLSALAVRGQGMHGKWAISNLLEAAHSPNTETLDYALTALNDLGTNALSIVPELREMLNRETVEARRKIIANAIQYISDSGPVVPAPAPSP